MNLLSKIGLISNKQDNYTVANKTNNSQNNYTVVCEGDTIRNLLNLYNKTLSKSILAVLFIDVAKECLSLLEKSTNKNDFLYNQLNPDNIMACIDHNHFVVRLKDVGPLKDEDENISMYNGLYKIQNLIFKFKNLSESYEKRNIKKQIENFQNKIASKIFSARNDVQEVVRKILQSNYDLQKEGFEKSESNNNKYEYNIPPLYPLGIMLAEIYPFYDEKDNEKKMDLIKKLIDGTINSSKEALEIVEKFTETFTDNDMKTHTKRNEAINDARNENNRIGEGGFGMIYLSSDKQSIIKKFYNKRNYDFAWKYADAEFKNIEKIKNNFKDEKADIEKYTLIDDSTQKIHSTMIQYKNCMGLSLNDYFIKICEMFKTPKLVETSKLVEMETYKKEVLIDLFIKVAFVCLSLLSLLNKKQFKHCDLKSDNIMICDVDGGTTVKIIDYGGITDKECDTKTDDYSIIRLSERDREYSDIYKKRINNQLIKDVIKHFVHLQKQKNYYNDQLDDLFALGIILSEIYPFYNEEGLHEKYEKSEKHKDLDNSINNFIIKLIACNINAKSDNYKTIEESNITADAALKALDEIIIKNQTGGKLLKKIDNGSQMKKSHERVAVGKRNAVVYINQHNRKYVRKSGKFVTLSSLTKYQK